MKQVILRYIHHVLKCFIAYTEKNNEHKIPGALRNDDGLANRRNDETGETNVLGIFLCLYVIMKFGITAPELVDFETVRQGLGDENLLKKICK